MTVKLLEPIVQSLQFPIYIQQLQAIADAEAEKRVAFYEWLTEDIKAEFINGEIIMHSPAKHRHTEATMQLTMLLRAYADKHDSGMLLTETALVALTRNDYLPDICFFRNDKAALITPDQMKYPPPDFVVEVLSPSTEKTDRDIKMIDYAAHNVQEYWLIDPVAQTVEQYILREGAYTLLYKQKTGAMNSEVVAGFSIPVEAIFDRKLKNQVLMGILADSE